MGVFKRFAAIVKAKVNKLLDRAEDPRDTLDQSYSEQLANLQKLRRSVAEVATARKRIEIQAQQLQQQATKLESQARAALSQQKEDLAREALSRRAAIGAELTDLKTQHDQVAEQEQRLIATMGRVQTQVERVPYPQGDAEGDLQRGGGPDPSRGSRLRNLGFDGRCREP